MFDNVNSQTSQNQNPSQGGAPSGSAPQKPVAPYGLQNKPAAPANPSIRPSQTPVEDIFAETEAESKPAELKPVSPLDKAPNGNIPSAKPEGSLKYIVVLIIILILIVAIGAGAYFGYNYFVKERNILPTNLPVNFTETEIDIPEAEEEFIEEIIPTPIENGNEASSAVSKDSDQDGLTDEEENYLGTNPNTADTDNDQLTDREEVKVYLTNPQNPDTDNDTYLDGAEVKAGYNPKGSGKLYDINSSIPKK